jgi:hypothetical protein
MSAIGTSALAAAPDWRSNAHALRSKGSASPKACRLADLHAARIAHDGQFFTPAPLALWVWRMLQPAMDRALGATPGGRVHVLDNSIGAGALLQFANPARHVLGGVDVDARAIDTLARDARAAGFACELSALGMERCRPRGFGVAVINPPFSLHLEAPTLTPGFATCYGRYGPDSSALSHAYGLQQALDAADIVAAILPRSYADGIVAAADAWPRLVACFQAPASTFATEGANVRVSVLFFGNDQGRAGAPVIAGRIDPAFSHVKTLPLVCRADTGGRLREIGIEDTGPTITRPVTGDRRVRMGHSGRKITLGFNCGLQEAKTRNAILRDRLVATGRRYPRGVRYVGQGALDIEIHLAQDDPIASLDVLCETIRESGAALSVDPGIVRYVNRRMRRLDLDQTPYRHTVLVEADMVGAGDDRLMATARKTQPLDPGVWGSPLILAGQSLLFAPAGADQWSCTVNGRVYAFSADALHQRFCVASGRTGDAWETVHPGRLVAFPDRAAALRRRAAAEGLDRFLSWDYQLDDLLELSMSRGGIAAWEMGLGKARLALGLVLLSGCKAGLICTEAYLIGEMVSELRKLGVADGLWQVIDSPATLGALRRVNLISYNRLRSPVCRGAGRRTYARALRRRIGTLVADEGDILRNKASQQTRALWQISAKRRYILSGTPLGNYPRDAFSLLGFAGGDATAAQRYGMRRFYLDPALRRSMASAVPGTDRVLDEFVTLEWVTNEFRDDLTTGAKREVPKLRNLGRYRAALAPHVKRRVSQEPDVLRHFQVPIPTRITTPVDWDDAHLAHYLAVAEEFRHWYMRRDKEGACNLVALLARIQAVQIAAAVPQKSAEKSPFTYAGGITSKQRVAAERLASLADAGHKAIAYAEFPALLEIVAGALRARGVAPVVIHGGIPVAERVQRLNRDFRRGECPVLLASLGVAQKGLNIPEADRVLFLTRSWTAKTERQAEGRVLRPQQCRAVTTEFLELTGSIDAYQRQMVEHKADAIRAGLDWGTPELADVDFLHLDTVLGRFVADLADLMGCRAHEVRQRLAA